MTDSQASTDQAKQANALAAPPYPPQFVQHPPGTHHAAVPDLGGACQMSYSPGFPFSESGSMHLVGGIEGGSKVLWWFISVDEGRDRVVGSASQCWGGMG